MPNALETWAKQCRYFRWRRAEMKRQRDAWPERAAAEVTRILEAAGYELRAPHLVDDVAPREGTEAAS